MLNIIGQYKNTPMAFDSVSYKTLKPTLRASVEWVELEVEELKDFIKDIEKNEYSGYVDIENNELFFKVNTDQGNALFGCCKDVHKPEIEKIQIAYSRFKEVKDNMKYFISKLEERNKSKSKTTHNVELTISSDVWEGRIIEEIDGEISTENLGKIVAEVVEGETYGYVMENDLFFDLPPLERLNETINFINEQIDNATYKFKLIG